MNVRTRATLSPDGSTYTLNGEKMWITNCGIAGLYTVFAKIEARKVFGLSDRARYARPHRWRGRAQAGYSRLVHLPARAAGLQSSSGEPSRRARQGSPHCVQRAQYGPLQAGRSLRGRCALCVGHMVRYAKERKAFGKSIAEFGLIQRKISAERTRLYAAESMAYRTVGMIDASLEQLGDHERDSARHPAQD